MILAKEQRIGAIILFVIALGAWLFVAIRNGRNVETTPPSGIDEKAVRDSLRRDSIARAKAVRDSLREVRWAHKKDSFQRVDSIRFATWSQERQQRYDSFRLADSLWHDSVGWRYAKRIKKDTTLDLNHTDTTELQYIRGIGRFKAIRIIAYREQLGGFANPAQLLDETLAEFELDSVLDHFTADPKDVKKINVNSAHIESMARHPYLRYNQAKAIYNLRRHRYHLESLDDLRGLSELSEEDLQRLAPYLVFE